MVSLSFVPGDRRRYVANQRNRHTPDVSRNCAVIVDSTRFCELYWRMETKPKQLARHLLVWELVSSAFASLLVFCAATLIAYWSLTGSSLIIDSQGGTSFPRDQALMLRLALRLPVAIGVSVFLTTYVLGSVWRGSAIAIVFALATTTGTWNTTVICLMLGPIVAGGLAGHYFNTFFVKQNDSEMLYVGFRVLALILCSSTILMFVPPYAMPALLVVLIWHLKCLIMLSGTIHYIWRSRVHCAVAI